MTRMLHPRATMAHHPLLPNVTRECSIEKVHGGKWVSPPPLPRSPPHRLLEKHPGAELPRYNGVAFITPGESHLESIAFSQKKGDLSKIFSRAEAKSCAVSLYDRYPGKHAVTWGGIQECVGADEDA